MRTLKISTGNEGGGGFHDSEMKIMINEHELNAFTPPVKIDNYSDFRSIASEAAVVVYSPDYYQGPFTDEPKRLCRFTLTAVGVRRNNILLTFKYVLDDVHDIDRVASEIILDLENLGNLVRGSVDASRPMGELLATWP